MKRISDEILIRRYLLGEVADEERERVEQRLLTDRQYFDQFLKVEESLTDEYVKGALIGHERERFETYFMSAPQRQESVEFAKTFNRYISEEKAWKPSSTAILSGEAAGWKQPAHLLRQSPSRTAIALLLVVMLAAIVGAVLLLMETARLKKQLLIQQTNLSQQEQELERQIVEQRERNEELARQLEQAQSELTQIEQEVTRLRQAGASNSQSSKLGVVSLILTPGLERSQGKTSRAYLSSGIQSLRLELKIDEQSYASYRAEVQTVEGKLVWRRDNLKGQQGKSGKTITVTLPTQLLLEGDYLVKLSRAAPGGYEGVGTYYFTVLRK